jgi:hypothetical protein
MKPEELEAKVDSLLAGHLQVSLRVLRLEAENEALREALAELFRRSGKDPQPWLEEVQRRRDAAVRRKWRDEGTGPGNA